MRAMGRLAGMMALAAALLRAGDARADVPSLDLRGFEPPTDPDGGLRYEPTVAPDTGEFNAGLWLSYAYRPVTLRDSTSGEVAFRVIDHQLSGDFIANVGLFKRLALGIDLPFVLYQQGDDPYDPANAAALATLGAYSLPAHALGDLRLVFKGTLLPPTSGEFGGFSMALVERFSLPTGHQESYLGEGHVTSETRLLLEYGLVAFAVHGSLGVKVRAEHENYGCAALAPAPTIDQPNPPAVDCPTRFGHEIPFGLALSVKPQAFGIDKGGHWTWFVETYGYLPMYPTAPFTDATLSQVQLGAGARYLFDNDLSLLAGIDAALVSGVGNAPVRATLALAWAPRKHDMDGDGIRDKDDICPDLPEDLDGFEDDDGCPEWDNDDDGVPDGQDLCPDEKEDIDGFEDDDGCPDPDNDGDGIPDVEDHCPLVPGLPSVDPTQRGCPDPDPDKDGVLGDADKCPNEKEDLDGFEDDDGCPDPDNDGDGILDVDDACPDEAGSPSPDFPNEHGCPDSDGDGIANGADACPDEPGVRSEDAEKNGCPEGE